MRSDRHFRLAPLAFTILGTAFGCGAGTPGTVDGGAGDAFLARDASTTAPDTGGPAFVRNEDFAEATTDVRNPDRGFYRWDDHTDAALVLVKVSLADQCDTPTLPGVVLDALRTRLASHRAGGRRVILRFNYADDGVLNRCGLADASSIDVVLGHVGQLAPIFTEYEDVIAFVEAGFLGMWGEWNQELAPAGTSLSEGEPNRDALLAALLAAVPATRSIGVRRPRFRDELGGTPEDLDRIGFHNDCFLASADDFGTYDGGHDLGYWKAYINDHALMVPMGGETCNDDVMYTACAHALTELELLRFTYLHEDYSPDVIARWAAGGCLEEIRRRLGYRIVIRAVEAPALLVRGQMLEVRVSIANLGFAPPYDARRVRIRLRNAAGDEVDLGTPARLNAARWAPGAVDVGFAVTGTIPEATPPGVWEIRLLLLEDASDLPAYAMLFANDERVRDDVRRENIVGTLTIAD